MLVTRGHTPKGLKTTDTDCLAALGAESPKLRCGQGCAPSEPSRAGARLPAQEAAAAFVFLSLRLHRFLSAFTGTRRSPSVCLPESIL